MGSGLSVFVIFRFAVTGWAAEPTPARAKTATSRAPADPPTSQRPNRRGANRFIVASFRLIAVRLSLGTKTRLGTGQALPQLLKRGPAFIVRGESPRGSFRRM